MLGANNTILKKIREEKEEINKGKEKLINISKLKKLISEIKVKGQKDAIFKEKKWKDGAKLIALLIADFEFELNAINKIEGITFEKFAKEIIESRRGYIQSLKEQDIEDKKQETIKMKDAVIDTLSTECSKQTSLLNKVKREAKQDKQKNRQEIEEEQARVKALDLLYVKAYEFKVMETIVQNQGIRELLTQQYTFLVLNTDYAEKFKDICSKYKNFREELKSKQLNDEQEKYVFNKEEEKHILDELAELNDEFNRVTENFIQREQKENESAKDNFKFDDAAINELRSHVIAEIKQARKAAEQEREALIEEKNAVEEIVMQLQRSETPSSAFSSVSHEPIAGPSWQI